MDTVTGLADEYWARLTARDAYYAMLAGKLPESIDPLDEATIADQADVARGLQQRLRRIGTPADAEQASLAAVLEHLLIQDVIRPSQLWHAHPAAPYQSYYLMLVQQAIASVTGPERTRLIAEFAALVGSFADIMRQQRRRGISLPAVAVDGVRQTWVGLRRQLSEALDSQAVAAACAEVLAEVENAAIDAPAEVGMANLPGGEQVYRSWVRRETTLDIEPEQLHRTGLEQCRELADRMAEVRSRLGGPDDEEQARGWVQAQSHLYATDPDEVAANFRRHVARVEPGLASLFRELPTAPYDVRRLDPAAEAGMTFGYYQPPSGDEPLGLYRFNGSDLDQRSQLTAAALILHELAPGHHFHLARQRENTSLHPLQQHTMALAAFNEGWGEYASGLGWELGAYDDDWDAYGRLAHERFTAQRLVVDTALNLGWWDLDKGREFMRANTLESERQIASETVRYSTDLPAQALAYRSGFLAFQRARESAPGLDVRDVHEAMLGTGAVPLPHMQERVNSSAS